MTSVQLTDLKGSKVGEVAFSDDVFGLEPNVHVLHAALQRQLANARSGSANSKTRSEVRGGGRKPWRQKGTGRARAGSIRSPLWNGGGVIFGPKPRSYYQSMPKKARQLALRSALAARKDDFVVVKNFDGLFSKAPKAGDDASKIEQPKTKAFAAVIKDLKLQDKCVILLLDNGVPGVQQIERAARNMANVCVLNVNNLNVKDLISAEAVLTSERTVEFLNNRFKAQPKSEQPKVKATRTFIEKVKVTREERAEQLAKAKAEKLKNAKPAAPKQPKVKEEAPEKEEKASKKEKPAEGSNQPKAAKKPDQKKK